MGKGSAPRPPDYAAAAREQGEANVNSAIASNFLNQVSQVGPNGSLTYTYDQANGYTLPDGTRIPGVTATTTLSPAQQQLLDQQNQIGSSLNNLAIEGIGHVGETVNTPIDVSALPAMTGSLNPSGADAVALRDQVTNAYMERLQPYIDRDRAAMQTRLANQGINNGSEAYSTDNDIFQRGVNDQRIAALLAGDQEQQNQFQRGLASAQFGNSARGQALQEAEFLRTEPLNMLNALRSGNQVSLPQFGNVAGGAQIGAAPIYQAASDQYAAAMQRYQAQQNSMGGLMSGLGSLGSAAILASDRRLKKNIIRLGKTIGGVPAYLFQYVWGKWAIGCMADEVAIFRPEALGPTIGGFATVNYGVLNA